MSSPREIAEQVLAEDADYYPSSTMGGMHPRFDGYMTVALATAYLELEAELADVRRVREVYRLVGAKRGTTIAELEAEKDALRTTYKALAKEERNELNRLEAERDEVIRYREENMRPALEHERAENTRLLANIKHAQESIEELEAERDDVQTDYMHNLGKLAALQAENTRLRLGGRSHEDNR